MNLSRKENGEYYTRTIQQKGIITPYIRDDSTHVYHQYAIRVTKEADISRDKLAECLHHRGIGTAIHYPVPIHKQPVYQGFVNGSQCPVSEKVSQEILSLPVYPGLNSEERASISHAVNGCVSWM